MKLNDFGTLLISDHLLAETYGADRKYKLNDFMNRKVFRVADTPLSYRQVNALDNDGMLGEKREQDRAWREFSLKEITYLSIVKELKEFGLEHQKLKPLWAAFFADKPNSKSAGRDHFKYVGETAICCVFARVEIVVVIDKDGNVLFLDPTNYAVHSDTLPIMPEAYIRLSLNTFVNRSLESMNKKPFPIKWSISAEYLKSRVLNISDKERTILDIIRNDDYQAVRVNKKSGETYVINAERSSGDDMTKADITNLIQGKDYQDISITKRDGKIVKLRVEETIKL